MPLTRGRGTGRGTSPGSQRKSKPSKNVVSDRGGPPCVVFSCFLALGQVLLSWIINQSASDSFGLGSLERSW
jgi:hypothetical protein